MDGASERSLPSPMSALTSDVGGLSSFLESSVGLGEGEAVMPSSTEGRLDLMAAPTVFLASKAETSPDTLEPLALFPKPPALGRGSGGDEVTMIPTFQIRSDK